MTLSIYALKPRFQALLRPMVGGLHEAGVSANAVTLSAALLSAVVGTVLALVGDPRVWLLLPAVLFVRMTLNAVDGMLAREFASPTRLGALLNELGDVVSDAALYLPFATLPHFGWVEVSVMVVLAGVTELTGVLGLTIGASRRYDGPMGKSDRAVAFGALALAVGLGLQPAPWVAAIMPGVILLLVWTVVSRATRALAETRSGGPS